MRPIPRRMAPKPKAPTTNAEARYRIQVVSEATGVSAATLRAWERRYGVPAPSRTEAAYRLYSDHDVEAVRQMSGHVAAGMSAAEAAKVVLAAERVPEMPGSRPDVSRAVRSIVDRVVAGDAAGLQREIAHALTLGPAASIFEDVVAPVQREIGERWHAGQLSVGQEHWVTVSLESAVRALHQVVQPIEAEASVVLACFEAEEHTLPLYGVAIRLASWGYRTIVLGARTPPDALASIRRSLHPSLIGLSVSIPPPAKHAKALISAYADACGPVPWVVGGLAVRPLAAAIERAGGIALVGHEFASFKRHIEHAVGRRVR